MRRVAGWNAALRVHPGGKAAALGQLLRRLEAPLADRTRRLAVGSTYAAACQFHPDGTLALGFAPGTPPDHGSYPGRLGALTPHPQVDAGIWVVADLAGELRRGWRPAGDERSVAATAQTPAPAAELVIERERPGGGATLELVHAGHDVRGMWIEGAEVHYVVREGDRRLLLEGVVWADWDTGGRMLVATRGGELEVRERGPAGWEPSWRHALGVRDPAPAEAPAWARRW